MLCLGICSKKPYLIKTMVMVQAISVLLFYVMLIFIITFIIRMYYQDENLR